MGGLGSCSHSSKQLKGMRSSMLVALAFMGAVSAQCLGAVTDRATTTGSAAGKQKKKDPRRDARAEEAERGA